MPPEHFDTDRGTLLRFVARCTAEVVREHCPGGGGLHSRPVIGFCFSFPVEQTALDNGKVLVWTKVGRRRRHRQGLSLHCTVGQGLGRPAVLLCCRPLCSLCPARVIRLP